MIKYDEIEMERAEKIAAFYDSEFVTLNMSYIRQIPKNEYIQRELAKNDHRRNCR